MCGGSFRSCVTGLPEAAVFRGPFRPEYRSAYLAGFCTSLLVPWLKRGEVINRSLGTWPTANHLSCSPVPSTTVPTQVPRIFNTAAYHTTLPSILHTARFVATPRSAVAPSFVLHCSIHVDATCFVFVHVGTSLLG